jgi:uncharacterized membrane protein
MNEIYYRNSYRESQRTVRWLINFAAGLGVVIAVQAMALVMALR